MPISDPIRWDCPACGQPAGERCRDADDYIMDDFHDARVDRAEVCQQEYADVCV